MKRNEALWLLALGCARPAEIAPHRSLSPEPRSDPRPLCETSTESLRLDSPDGALLVDRTEVTQSAWQALTTTQPSLFDGCGTCPVERVSFAEVAAALNRRSLRAGLAPCYAIDRAACFDDFYGCRQERPFCAAPCAATVVQALPDAACGFRVPTLLEWAVIVAAGDAPTAPRSNGATRPVRSEVALDGVAGNVWEWLAPTEGRGLIAGGGWTTSPEGPKAGHSQPVDLRLRASNIGVRAVRSCPSP